MIVEAMPQSSGHSANMPMDGTPPPAVDDSPVARMNRRFPQKIRIGHLVGAPVLDDDDRTLGYVTQVVKSPEGQIRLIVAYNGLFGWFGWFTRPVAVPIEVVASLGPFVASIDMDRAAYRAAPTWTQGRDVALPDDAIIRIALTKR